MEAPAWSASSYFTSGTMQMGPHHSNATSRDELERREFNAWLDAAMVEDEGGVADWTTHGRLKFELFQRSATYERHPSDLAFYLELREEYLARGRGGLDFDAYYTWFFESSHHVTPDGNVSLQSQELFQEHEHRFSARPRDEIMGTFYSVQNVHPRHRAAFEVLFDRVSAKE
jgi:hypothetical protein